MKWPASIWHAVSPIRCKPLPNLPATATPRNAFARLYFSQGSRARGGGRKGGVMAMERNGVVFFDPTAKNDDHPAFKALKAVSLGDVRFPFGFFLIETLSVRSVSLLPASKNREGLR
jgi:hypothetical protein